MWAAYVFALIAFVSLPQALTAFTHGDTVTGVNWLAQSFLQLVLLPIIIVGQQIISAAQDARAEARPRDAHHLHAINLQQAPDPGAATRDSRIAPAARRDITGCARRDAAGLTSAGAPPWRGWTCRGTPPPNH